MYMKKALICVLVMLTQTACGVSTTEQITVSETEPATESTTELVTEPATESTTELVTEPATEVIVVAEYNVQDNDTLYSISVRNGISIDDIIAYNGLEENETIIYVGQTLLLPGVDTPVYASNYTDNNEVWYNSVTLYNAEANDSSWYNIELAASYLNGMELGPGQYFSWASYMGPNDESQGYVEAPIYFNGTIDTAPGGGVCFVSTTLMQAARGGGCIVTEKHDHSLPVSYASPGDEASVNWGSWDLQFYNPSNLTLVFYVSTDASSKSCTISCNVR